MLISELSFPHLQAAHEARLSEELERRRVVREILEEQAAIERAMRPATRYRRRRALTGPRSVARPSEPCPT